MKILKAFFPGSFEDAYLYMGFLLMLTVDKRLVALNLEKTMSSVDQATGGFPTAMVMFSRNDWLKTNLLRLLMADTSIRRRFLSLLDRFPHPFAEVYEVGGTREIPLGIPAHVILDLHLYNRRLYVGADTGLFHVDLGWEQDEISRLNSPVKRLDARCIQASAKYGALSACCGPEGLFTAVDEFGWFSPRNGSPKRIAERSLRASWFGDDLVNYPDNTTATLLLGESRHEAPRGIERERHVLTDLGDISLDLGYLLSFLVREHGFETDSIQYVHNTGNTLFVHTIEGNFYAAGLAHTEQGSPQARYTKTYKGIGTRILSTNSCRTGLVVETDDRVLLFAAGEWWTLVESEVLSVRTFARSKRFQNIAAITAENGIFLVSMFDEASLLPKSPAS